MSDRHERDLRDAFMAGAESNSCCNSSTDEELRRRFRDWLMFWQMDHHHD